MRVSTAPTIAPLAHRIVFGKTYWTENGRRLEMTLLMYAFQTV